MMHMTLVRRATVAGLAATLLMAAPAAADPFFEPDEAPVDSVVELELDLAHGCFAGAGDGGHSHGDEDDEEPTLEVAVEVPEEVDLVEPEELDGWELEVEAGDDGRVEVITWLAEEGTEDLAPVFELTAVHRGEVGDEVYWPVFQGCEDASYRWIATAEGEEGDPAPSVTLVEADPDAPAPEPDEVDEVEDADDPADADDPDADEDALDPEADDEEAEELDAEDAGDEGGLPGWLLLVVVLVVLAVVGVVLAIRSRGGDGGDAVTDAGA
jgi:uncharacterized protein YcnI